MKRGESFFYHGNSPVRHLYVVIDDGPVVDGQPTWMAVNVTDMDGHPDDSCILDVGDHPFITKRSCINYARMSLWTLRRLDDAIRAGDVTPYPHPFSDELLDRIFQGATSSPWVRTSYRNWLCRPRD